MLLCKGLGSKEFFFFKGKDKPNKYEWWQPENSHDSPRLYFSAVLLCEDIMILISLSYQI